MKTIKVIECDCGEDVYEDDKDESGQLRCISCYKAHEPSDLKETEIADITHVVHPK
jgi:hypothetical protein